MLASLSQLKKFLNITDTDQDPIMYDSLVRAHKEVETYCDRLFELAQRTEYYRVNNNSTLNLREYPVVESGVYSLVMYDDLSLSWAASTLIAAADYQIDHAFGQVTLLNGNFQTSVNPRLKNIKVSYGAGYTADTVPADLLLAILDIAAAGYKKTNTYLNAVSQSTESENDSGDLKSRAEGILDSYKRIR